MTVKNCVTYREAVNVDKLEFIVRNIEQVYDHIVKDEHRSEENGGFKDFFTTMKNLLIQKKKSEIVVYGFGRNCNWGRVFAKTPSLQPCWKPVRHCIADGQYYDLDLKNCHPTILYDLLEKFEWKNNYMKEYIDDREGVLKIIGEQENIGRDDSKKDILEMINGGREFTKYDKYMAELRNNHYEFMEHFYKHCCKTTDMRKFYDKAKNKIENKYGSCLNNYFCDEENNILQKIISYIEDNDIEISTLCFDGLQVYKKDVNDIDALLKGLNEYIQDEYPSHTICEKEMNLGLDLSLFKSKKNIEIDRNIEDAMAGDQESSAEIVFNHLKDDLKYDGILYKFDYERCLWVMTKIDILQIFIKTYLISLFEPIIKNYKVVDEDTEKQLKLFKKTLSRLGLSSYTNGIYTLLSKMVQNRCYDDKFIADNFDKKIGLLPLRNNKTFDLRKCELRDRIREDYFTFEMETNYIQDYDEDTCVNYFKSLMYDYENENECSQELYDNFVTMLGYTMTGENNLAKFFNLYGEGRNGKSFVLDLMNEIMGSYAGQGTKRVFTEQKHGASTHDADLFKIKNTRLITIMEMKDTEQFNETLIKSLTGGDKIQLRNCGSEKPITVKFQCIPVIATNQIAKFDQCDIAFQNRIIVFNFKNVFEKNDKYVEMIMNMKDHIFSYLCNITYNNYYLKNKDIIWCKEVVVATNDVMNFRDTIIDFLDNNHYEKCDDAIIISRNEIYENYINYCGSNHIDRNNIIKIQAFFKRFEKMMNVKNIQKKIGGENVRGYQLKCHASCIDDDSDDDF